MSAGWNHPTMTESEYLSRAFALIADEIAEWPDEGWWWLSFCDPARPEGDRFLGVAVVRGHGVYTASQVAWEKGCNPGGEVVGIPVPDEHVPPEGMRERLLSRADLDAAGLA